MKWYDADGREIERKSLPVRGAWIEIVEPLEVLFAEFVAPRAGSVD